MLLSAPPSAFTPLILGLILCIWNVATFERALRDNKLLELYENRKGEKYAQQLPLVERMQETSRRTTADIGVCGGFFA